MPSISPSANTPASQAPALRADRPSAETGADIRAPEDSYTPSSTDEQPTPWTYRNALAFAAPAAPPAPAENKPTNPLDKIPRTLLPDGKSNFDFSLSPRIGGSGSGTIKRDNNKISIDARPNRGGARHSTLEPDPKNPGKTLLTRADGEKHSGTLDVKKDGSVHFHDDKDEHTLTIKPAANGANGFTINSTGMGLESRFTTNVTNMRKAE